MASEGLLDSIRRTHDSLEGHRQREFILALYNLIEDYTPIRSESIKARAIIQGAGGEGDDNN